MKEKYPGLSEFMKGESQRICLKVIKEGKNVKGLL